LADRAGLDPAALQAAGEQARRLVFVATAERVLWCQIAAFALAFLLVPLLPARPQVPEWDERR
jgi:hypothetical protein